MPATLPRFCGIFAYIYACCCLVAGNALTVPSAEGEPVSQGAQAASRHIAASAPLLRVPIRQLFSLARIAGVNAAASIAHVIVVGTGLAGHAAAIEAHRQGARVTMIEKEARYVDVRSSCKLIRQPPDGPPAFVLQAGRQLSQGDLWHVSCPGYWREAPARDAGPDFCTLTSTPEQASMELGPLRSVIRV